MLMEELDGAKSLFCFNSDHQGGHFLGVNFFLGKKNRGGGWGGCGGWGCIPLGGNICYK